MVTPSASRSILEKASTRADIARACRDLCLQRERTPSESLPARSEAVTQLYERMCATHGAEVISDAEFAECYDREELRVTDAVILADLIAQKLAEKPSQISLEKSPVASQSPGSRRPPPSKPAHEPRSGPLGIADLLDGMLDQERAAARSPHSSAST